MFKFLQNNIGQSLVGGRTSPQKVVVFEDRIIKEGEIADYIVRKLYDLGKQVSDLYCSQPQDIEWAFEGQKLY